MSRHFEHVSHGCRGPLPRRIGLAAVCLAITVGAARLGTGPLISEASAPKEGDVVKKDSAPPVERKRRAANLRTGTPFAKDSNAPSPTER